jgi:Tol biopolymer transport system component
VSIGSNQPLPSYGFAASDVFLRDREQHKTELVSVNRTGDGGGNASSIPYGLSTNLQRVLFESNATNLVNGDTNGTSDIFLRDRVNQQTVLVSVATNGLAGNGASRNATMTPDARYVAFVSEATDLVPNDTNGIADVFVRDMLMATTALVSVRAKNWATGGSTSESPIITPDGRYVFFYSSATDLVPGQTNAHIYVRHLAQANTICVSADAPQLILQHKGPLACYSFSPVVTDDGQTVFYEACEVGASTALVLKHALTTGATEVIHTNATVGSAQPEWRHNLEITPDGRHLAFIANTNGITGATTCVLVWDSQTGTFDIASSDMSGAVPADTTCDSITMDATGRYVSFLSDALLTTNSTGDSHHLYVRDRQAGTTLLVDAGTNGEPASVGPAGAAAMNDAEPLIAFECLDGSLTPGDNNVAYDVFVRDLTSGKIEMISARDSAFDSLTPSGMSIVFPSALSADGRGIAFTSDGDDLVLDDANAVRDVFLRDLLTGTTQLVSANSNGVPGNAFSSEPAITPDGRFVVFSSSANDLVPKDSNGFQDVFMRDLQTGTTTLISVSTNGTSGNNESYGPAFSSDGTSIIFRSRGTDLAPVFAVDNLFLRELPTGVTRAISKGRISPSWSATPNHQRVAFAENPTLSKIMLFVWDKSKNGHIYTNATVLPTVFALSPDGARLVYATNRVGLGGQIFLVEIASQTQTSLCAASASTQANPRFSGDGQYLTFSAALPGAGAKYQIYLFDLQNNTNTILSRTYETGLPANDNSDMPEISSDGRFIAYRSEATDLVPGDTNGVPDIFLFDRLTGGTLLVTSSRFGPYSADNRSLTPVFSADGRTLAFTSWASDLLPGDFNGWSDVFALSLYSSEPAPLFRACVSSEAQGCRVTWPALPGRSYRVQFKSNLADPQWQDLWGQAVVVGNQGVLQDLAPGANQRFYRIVAF